MWLPVVAPGCGQVNTLHSCSFLCLAVSAASFAYRCVWPARAALAIPFLLSAAQGLKPDSPESLAVRLWEEWQGPHHWNQFKNQVQRSVEWCNKWTKTWKQWIATVCGFDSVRLNLASYRRQELETHVPALQRGELVEVVAETGLNPSGRLLFFLLGTSMGLRIIMI